MGKSKKAPPRIDRVVPGVGRITIRASKYRKDTRDALDVAISRAVAQGEINPLRLLKAGQLSALEFLEASRTNKLAVVGVREPLEPLLASWLATGGLRASSAERYRQSWKFLLEELPKEPTLQDISPNWWVRFATVRVEHVGNATLNRDRAALLAFLGWAARSGHEVPEIKPDRLPEDPKRSEILSPKEIERLEKEIARRAEKEGGSHWLFYNVLLETGARQGEVLNLHAEDIDPIRPSVRFRPQEGSKGHGEARYVLCSDWLHQQLLKLAGTPRARIFSVSRRTAQDRWDILCREVEISGVTMHGIRATAITRCLDGGLPAVEVQKLAGHSDLAMTMRYYRNPKTSDTTADQMRKLMRGQEAGSHGTVAPPATPLAPAVAPVEKS